MKSIQKRLVLGSAGLMSLLFVGCNQKHTSEDQSVSTRRAGNKVELIWTQLSIVGDIEHTCLYSSTTEGTPSSLSISKRLELYTKARPTHAFYIPTEDFSAYVKKHTDAKIAAATKNIPDYNPNAFDCNAVRIFLLPAGVMSPENPRAKGCAQAKQMLAEIKPKVKKIEELDRVATEIVRNQEGWGFWWHPLPSSPGQDFEVEASILDLVKSGAKKLGSKGVVKCEPHMKPLKAISKDVKPSSEK